MLSEVIKLNTIQKAAISEEEANEFRKFGKRMISHDPDSDREGIFYVKNGKYLFDGIKPKFLGLQDPNSIIRNEVSAFHGDTFVSETLDRTGFFAYRVMEHSKEHENYKHFLSLGRGTLNTALTFAREGLND